MTTKTLTQCLVGMAVGISMVLIGLLAKFPYLVVFGNLLTGASQLLGLVTYFDTLPEGDVSPSGRPSIDAPVSRRVA